ncbi:hypothetical protein Hanom_Chr11g00986271 [Helianthus anomalus]
MTKAGRHMGDDCPNRSIGTNHEDKRCSFPDRRESPEFVWRSPPPPPHKTETPDGNRGGGVTVVTLQSPPIHLLLPSSLSLFSEEKNP